jgi:hypothetical protein
MSGTGTMTPAVPGIDVTATPLDTGCVSFQRSLELLMLDNKCGAYGFVSTEYCGALWRVYQREGWLQKLRAAEAELKRDLGASLCPEEICDELHPAGEMIRVNQAPIAYLGRRTYSDWTERELVEDGDDWYILVCDAELGDATIEDVQVAYPIAVTESYAGLQYLQDPHITRIYGSCLGGDGYQLTWPKCQLVHPAENEVTESETAKFITDVKWRIATVDATLAVEMVGECDCDCCSSSSTPTISIADATEGLVCLDNWCGCGRRQVRINYATAFSGCATMDPGLEEAVVMLALLKTAGSPVKPCGCDNNYTAFMLEIDPTAKTEFAHKLAYGPTNAGMTVWRTMVKYKERPHFNQAVISGGMLSGKKMSRSRNRSYLRGY